MSASGLQHERTTLAWERTAVSIVGVGLLLTRVASVNLGAAFAVFGLIQVAAGAGLVVWAGVHRTGGSPTHPTAARIVGRSTCVFVATALAVAVAVS